MAGALLFVLAPSASALPLLSHNGRWLTDPQGRVVILHGLQVDRFEPTAPIEFIDLNPANVDLMAAEGFNLARVSLAYAGYEPVLGAFDQTYLDSYLAFDRRLAQAGVYDLLDMMQGQYSAVLTGWGFPDWMTVTDSLPNGKEPFPQGYFANPAEDRAWDNLYADAHASDGVGLQEHYAAGLGRIAGQFAQSPGLLGLEILNEPWAGSMAGSCITPAGCPPGGFDQISLTDFYRRMVPAVRAADPRHLIAYEPNLLFDFGDATGLGSIGDPNLMLAFHNYCLAYNVSPGNQPSNCATEEQTTLANADIYQQQTGVGLLMDEWGNTTDTSTIARVAAAADQHMVGWADWALEDCCKSAAAVVRDGSKPPAPDNVNAPVLDALVRPYPRAIAGTPTSWSYDPASRAFLLDYQAKLLDGRPASGLQTEIFVPQRHYRTGYQVQVSGASIASTPTAGILRLCSNSAAANVSVTVTPADGSSTDPPDQAQASSACPVENTTSVTGGAYTVSANGGRVGVSGLADVALPRTRRCLSHRRFAVHVVLHRGTRLLRKSVTVDRRRVPVQVSHGGTMLTARIDLRGLTRGRYRVRITLRVIRAGRPSTITIARVVHTCVKGHHK